MSRAENRVETTRTIQATARRHLAEVGPAALSLRAIAREVGLVSSAVYRYFPSRDALLTALIVEGYDDLADALDAGVAAVDQPSRHDLRWRAACHAVRDWAHDQPHRYALLYGSPVPGYVAPADTVSPAVRIPLALLQVVSDAQGAGARPVAPVPVTRAEHAGLGPVRAFTEPPLDPDVAVRGTLAWATLFGTISLELFGHMHRGILDYDAHFAQVVDQLAADLGLGD